MARRSRAKERQGFRHPGNRPSREYKDSKSCQRDAENQCSKCIRSNPDLDNRLFSWLLPIG